MQNGTRTRLCLLSTLAGFVMVLAGCGGTEKHADEPTGSGAGEPGMSGHEHGGEHGSGEHEMGGGKEHDFPAGVAAFHDLFAPAWHADEGAERVNGACDQTDAFRLRAEAIETEPVPEPAAGDEAAWREAAKGLVASIDALKAECASEGRPEFDARFKGVHDAFHVLVGLIGHDE